MEQNKNKLQEETPEEITEGILEEVTGGGIPIGNGRNCFFEPTNPVKHEIRGGVLRAACKSICAAPPGFDVSCSCRGTDRCIDRWHTIEKFNGTTYVASPQGQFNHNEQRKWVNGVNL